MNKQPDRVLLVEDEPSWQELLSEMVVDMGFAPRRADSYAQAIAALDEGSYALALLDVSLVEAEHGNQDGLRVLEQFRLRYPHTPAIILTGYATVDLAVKALAELRADDFLRKEQFDRQQFRDMIARVQGTPLHAAPVAPPALRTLPLEAGQALDARVLVVEDNPAWQSIYEELLEERGARMALAVSYGEARGLLQRHAFDVAIVDLRLASSTSPNENRDGFFLLRLTQEAHVPTVVISALGDHHAIDRAYEEYGIFSFLDKEGFHRGTFFDTLHAALKRGPLLPTPPALDQGPLAALTERQLEVLALLVQGKTNNEIAEELIVSVNTIKKHVLAIFATLDVNSRAAAAGIAAQYGLLPEPRE